MRELLRRVPADAVYGSQVILDIANAYLIWAARFGLRADVLWAQMLYETGGLRFGGEVRPEQYNFCGLRLKDGSGYYSFPTPEAGVLAHVAHLAVHVLPDCPRGWRAECLSDPKHPEGHWQDMRVLYDLETAERAWCSTHGYAAAVCRCWNV